MASKKTVCRCGKHHVCSHHLTVTTYTRSPWWSRFTTLLSDLLYRVFTGQK